MANDEYTLVDGGEAPKIAKHSKGKVNFDVLKNQSEKLFIRMIHTEEDKGTFSDKIISLSDIYNCVRQHMGINQSISAQPFKKLFSDGDKDSHSFLAAVLRKIGLLKKDPDKPTKHLVKEHAEWSQFEAEMLATEGIPRTK
ncbi:MAG: hypothetical protein PHC99_03475 [Methylococcales bacterium]|nr:hypothetical protein [Methylococcales bacterium]